MMKSFYGFYTQKWSKHLFLPLLNTLQIKPVQLFTLRNDEKATLEGLWRFIAQVEESVT